MKEQNDTQEYLITNQIQNSIGPQQQLSFDFIVKTEYRKMVSSIAKTIILGDVFGVILHCQDMIVLSNVVKHCEEELHSYCLRVSSLIKSLGNQKCLFYEDEMLSKLNSISSTQGGVVIIDRFDLLLTTMQKNLNIQKEASEEMLKIFIDRCIARNKKMIFGTSNYEIMIEWEDLRSRMSNFATEFIC